MNLVQTLINHREEISKVLPVYFKIRDVTRTVVGVNKFEITYLPPKSSRETQTLTPRNVLHVHGVVLGSRFVKSPLIFLVR